MANRARGPFLGEVDVSAEGTETPGMPGVPPKLADFGVPAPAPLPQGFVFHGKPAEYFRIWIVNTLLSLLTLGVFLAWAKVRKRRYLRGCTEFLGHRFDYRADPRRILVGNIVVVFFFFGYAVFGAVYPTIRIGVLVIGALMLPWVVVRSLSFNAHNTVYRGMRFRFHSALGGSVMLYFFESLLILVTLGIYYPAWDCSKRRFVVNHHRLGDAFFRFDGGSGAFYSAYLVSGAIFFGAMMAAGFVVALFVAARGPQAAQSPIVFVPIAVVYAVGIFFCRQYVYANLFNHVWNHTCLDSHRFSANLRIGRWLGMQMANLFWITITLGLMYPWAMIRAKQMLAESLTFHPAGPIEEIRAMGSAAGSGVGDSAAEFMGLDFGL